MKRLLVAAAIAALFSSPALAGFSYDDISESSPTGDALTFGTPDILDIPPAVIADFDPLGFSATVNGQGSDFSDGRLEFTINATDDRSIDVVSFREAGSYELLNGGSQVRYSLTVLPTIRGVNGALAFIPLDGITVFGSQSSGTGNWLLELDYDILAAAQAKGLQNSDITSVEFEINNRLTAVGTEQNSGAFVDKKDFTVTAIPEPSSFLFLGLVTSGAMVWQKKRRLELVEA